MKLKNGIIIKCNKLTHVSYIYFLTKYKQKLIFKALLDNSIQIIQ